MLKAVLICWSAVFLQSVKQEQWTWECVWFHAGFDISLASLELSWTGGENAEDLLDLCWEILLRLPVYVIREQLNLWCITFAIWTAMLFTNTFTDTFNFDSTCGSEFVFSFTNYTDIFGNFRTGWMALSTPVAFFFYKYVTACIGGIVGSFHVWPFGRRVEHSVGWNCASVTIVRYNVFCQLFYLTGMVLISLFNQRKMSCQALLEVVIRISDIINYAHIRSSLWWCWSLSCPVPLPFST